MQRTLAFALCAFLAACTPGSDAPPVAFPSDTPPAPPTRLLYVDRTTLKSYDLASGASELITELPSADVAVSPDGRLLAVVEETHPQGVGPEGFRRPRVLITGTTQDEIPSELGPGRAPEWAPNSTAVAVIETTARGETIAIYQLPGGKITLPAPSDELWSLVGWSGEEIVAIGSRSGVIAFPTDSGEPRSLKPPPAQLWGVSPVESRHVVISGRAGVIAGPGGRVQLDVPAALGDGGWSHDGRTIAVTLIRGTRTQLALIDVASGADRVVLDGKGAQGNIVWALDNKTFAFVRVDPEKKGRLQAVVCTTSTECSVAFSWDEGARLLAFS